MKLLIAGLATGLLLAGAPVWADPWKHESGHGWHGKHWEKHHRHWDRHHRHWDRHHRYHDGYYYYRAPRESYYYYYYYDYSYRYPAPGVYFSWSGTYHD